MRVTPGIEKLRSLGYRVREVPPSEMPLSLALECKKMGMLFELTIGGQKVWNNKDRYGWFFAGELAEYAAQVPNVKQASMEDLLYAPF